MKEQRKMLWLRSTLAALLLLAMLLAAVSCGKKEKNDNPSSGTTGDSGSPTGEVTTADEYDIPDAVGDRNYGNATIRVASTNRTWYDDEVTVARPTGDIIDDAVYKRNKAVEARLSVNITNTPMGSGAAPQYAVSNQLRQDKLNGMDNIDIAWNPVYSTIMYTSEGILSNLLAVPNLDLSAGYWSQLFNETASIGNAQYMATGPISLSYYRYVFVTYVNKPLRTYQIKLITGIDKVRRNLTRSAKAFAAPAEKKISHRLPFRCGALPPAPERNSVGFSLFPPSAGTRKVASGGG